MKRSHAEAWAGPPESENQLLAPPILQTKSLKDHFRVTKPRQPGKENACGFDASPPAKVQTLLQPLLQPLLPPLSKHFKSGQKQSPQVPATVIRATTTPQAALHSSAPVSTGCGISLSTAPFEFPAPSEDTCGAGDINSRLPGYDTTAAGLFLRPAQHQTISTADPDEVSCRHRPLPVTKPISLPTHITTATTFSSCPSCPAEPEYSTASLASWLPGRGCLSRQAAGCAADESDCEDDAASHRLDMLLPAAAAAAEPALVLNQTGTTAPAAKATHTAAGGSGNSRAQLSPGQGAEVATASDPDAGGPVCGSEEFDEGVSAADLMALLTGLAQGGATGGLSSTHTRADGQEGTGRVVYQTRLEELLFGMSYVAAPASDDADGAEE